MVGCYASQRPHNTHAHSIVCGIPRAFGGLFNIALSILKMGPVLFGGTENLIAYLQRKGLLATNKQCPNCAGDATSKRHSGQVQVAIIT